MMIEEEKSFEFHIDHLMAKVEHQTEQEKTMNCHTCNHGGNPNNQQPEEQANIKSENTPCPQNQTQKGRKFKKEVECKNEDKLYNAPFFGFDDKISLKRQDVTYKILF
jgi:hypothetical protein